MDARIVIAIIEVDDDKAIKEDLGTIDYLEKEFGWLENSNIFLQNARIIDEDDEYDAKAIRAVSQIFDDEYDVGGNHGDYMEK